MRRVFMTTLVVALAFMASIGSRPAAAQTVQQLRKFEVLQGTTLWDLAKQTTGNGGNWHAIFDANYRAEILDSTDIKINSLGDTIVHLRPLDIILLPENAEGRAFASVTRYLEDSSEAISAPQVIEISSGSGKFGLLWYALALIVILGLAWALRLSRSVNHENEIEIRSARQTAEAERNWATQTQALYLAAEGELRNVRSLLEEAQRPRHPAETFTDLEVRGLATGYRRQRTDDEGEGPSFISGGINSPMTLELALQRAAQIEGVRRNPDAPVTAHTRYVFRQGRRGKVVAGRYSSLFSDGTERVRVIEHDKPETHRIVWKATTVAPDGTEFEVYAEEVCANGMAIPANVQGDLVWEVLPDVEQMYTLPARAIYVDPPAPDAPEPAPVEMVSVVTVTTPDGRIIHVPAGSTVAPAQIPASEMISPSQGSETAS